MTPSIQAIPCPTPEKGTVRSAPSVADFSVQLLPSCIGHQTSARFETSSSPVLAISDSSSIGAELIDALFPQATRAKAVKAVRRWKEIFMGARCMPQAHTVVKPRKPAL